MANTVLDPFMNGKTLVKVITTAELTEKERQEIAYAVLRVHLRHTTMNGHAPLRAIKHAVQEYNPELAKKIVSRNYC